MYARFIRRSSVGAAIAAFLTALAVLLGAAAGAKAGRLTLLIDGGGAGCNLLTPYSESAWLSASSCGAGPAQVGYHALDRALIGSRIDGPDMLHFSLAEPVAAGTRAGFQITAPTGFTINSATISSGSTSGINTHQGWGGASYWATGHNELSSNVRDFHGNAANRDGPFNSPYWGVVMACGWARCSNPGQISLNAVTLTATETQAPSLTAIGSNNLWYQAGHWIWNAPGDPWPLTLGAADSSGICALDAEVSAHIQSDPLPAPNLSQWQQCPNPTWTPSQGAAVDTRDYVPSAGQMPVTLAATNAAGNQSQVSETLNVDNDPVSVSLSTPDDPNPSVWVNHSVIVRTRATAGPSGLGGETCSRDGQTAEAYTSRGLTVDGDGVTTISCTAWDQAVDPQGNHASATSSLSVHIDEAPPSVSIEPGSAGDPTGLVADTSDRESGVAGGRIEMAPAGSDSWTSVPTTFSGSQLEAHFDDSGLHGRYVFRATSCDNVGNCASTDRTVALPVREGAVSDVGVGGAASPRCVSALRAVRAARLAGRQLASDLRLARSIGRQPGRISTTAGQDGRAGGCAAPVPFGTRARVRFGQSVVVRGVLRTSGGAPLAGQPVEVLSAPDNGSAAFSHAAAVTTAANGSWSATLPAGPSRIIRATFPGSANVLPATGEAKVVTPAKVEITRVTPHRTRWGGTVWITGQVLGGYVPASSKLLRLDLGIIGIPGFSKIQGIPNISPDGHFRTHYTFTRLYGVVRFWLKVSTLSEADFPFAKAHSRRVIVTVGARAPAAGGGPRRHGSTDAAMARKHVKHRHRHQIRRTARAAGHRNRHRHRHRREGRHRT